MRAALLTCACVIAGLVCAIVLQILDVNVAFLRRLSVEIVELSQKAWGDGNEDDKDSTEMARLKRILPNGAQFAILGSPARRSDFDGNYLPWYYTYSAAAMRSSNGSYRSGDSFAEKYEAFAQLLDARFKSLNAERPKYLDSALLRLKRYRNSTINVYDESGIFIRTERTYGIGSENEFVIKRAAMPPQILPAALVSNADGSIQLEIDQQANGSTASQRLVAVSEGKGFVSCRRITRGSWYDENFLAAAVRDAPKDIVQKFFGVSDPLRRLPFCIVVTTSPALAVVAPFPFAADSLPQSIIRTTVAPTPVPIVVKPDGSGGWRGVSGGQEHIVAIAFIDLGQSK